MTKQKKCPFCNTVKEKNKRLCLNILCTESKPYKNRKNAEEKENKKILKNILNNIIKNISDKEKERKKIEKERKKIEKENEKQKQKEIRRKRKEENQTKRGEKALLSRWSDQYYYYTRVIYDNHYNKMNPKFTEEDRKKKCEILNITNCKTCFISNEKSKGVGDHLFEINGYAKVTNGKHGTYDEWNTVPVIGKLNKSYKKFKFENGNTKDIGYQKLTQEEFNECSEKNKDIYIKIMKWQKYVLSRGARLYWEMTEKQSLWLDQKEKEYKRIVMKDIQEIKMLN